MLRLVQLREPIEAGVVLDEGLRMRVGDIAESTAVGDDLRCVREVGALALVTLLLLAVVLRRVRPDCGSKTDDEVVAVLVRSGRMLRTVLGVEHGPPDAGGGGLGVRLVLRRRCHVVDRVRLRRVTACRW